MAKSLSRANLRALAESAVMIAVATVLSVLKLVDLPYGGSVTLASIFPIVLNAYRNGAKWGFGAAFAYGVLQQLLGLENLSYVTGRMSVVAIVLFDYLLAFGAAGLGGLFRGKRSSQASELIAGAALVCFLRYLCHVISGAFVWAECLISLPNAAAIFYSLGYNATYMIPETIVTVLVAEYLGSALDFRRETPAALGAAKASSHLRLFARLCLVVGGIVDVLLIFPKLQDAESGAFSVAGITDLPFVALAAVTLCAVAAFAVLTLIDRRKR